MPSGAKKRKAAKKKKQSGAHTTNNNSNNNNLPGIDEVKTQDSDGSGLSTPVSQDRDSHQSPFDVGGEDLEKRDPSAVGSFSSESKPMEGSVSNGEDAEKVVSEGEGVVEVVRESGSQVDAESKTVGIEHVQSSSSSSSSDDDSREDEKKENEEEPSLTVLVSEQVNQLMEKATDVEVSSLRYKDESSSSSNPSDDESRVDEKKVTEEAHNSVVEEPSSSADLVPKEVIQPKEEAAVEEEIHVKECVSIQNSVASNIAVSVSKQNGEKLLTKPDGLTGASPSEVDSEPKNLILNKNGEVSSNAVKSPPEESEGKVVPSSHNGTEHTKKTELPQYPENEHQLPVVAPPRPVQTTSWKGCCGLFEVFVGSNR